MGAPACHSERGHVCPWRDREDARRRAGADAVERRLGLARVGQLYGRVLEPALENHLDLVGFRRDRFLWFKARQVAFVNAFVTVQHQLDGAREAEAVQRGRGAGDFVAVVAPDHQLYRASATFLRRRVTDRASILSGHS